MHHNFNFQEAGLISRKLTVRAIFDLDHGLSRFPHACFIEQFVVTILAKVTSNRWFVSATLPKKGKQQRSARQTKGFPTEAEAKQFAQAMFFDGYDVTAGMLSPHKPIRRTIAAREVYRWVEEER